MIHKNFRLILVTAVVTLGVFFLLEKRILPGGTAGAPAAKGVDLLSQVVRLIKNDYVEERNPVQTMEGAYKGLVNSLDPYSGYLDKDTAAKYFQRKEGRLNETGLVLYKKGNSFSVIAAVLENSPAEKKGLKVGDYLSAIDGRSTLLMSLAEASLSLEDKGTAPVKVRVLREADTLNLEIERIQIAAGPFSYRGAEGTSGILKINYLLPPCVAEIKKAVLPRLKSEKKPLVLDLTNCSEGTLDEARKLINLFLKANSIGYLEKRAGGKIGLACLEKPELKDLPLVVWENQATMGPAEIIVAVLQEFKRARAIGLPTVGATGEQEFFPLDGGSGLVLTSSIFHLNSGANLFGEGIKPDVKLEIGDQSQATFLKKTVGSGPSL